MTSVDSSEKRAEKPAGKPAGKPVVLDTLTTRFLMLFVMVLIIPLFSLIIFTLTLLKNHLDNSAINQVLATDSAWMTLLEEKRQGFQMILERHAGTNSGDLRQLCPPAAGEICFRLDFDRNRVVHADGRVMSGEGIFQAAPDLRYLDAPYLDALGGQRQAAFYALWEERLFLFVGQREHGQRNVWLVLGMPLDTVLLNAFYRKNPTLGTTLWILREPLAVADPEWLSDGPAGASRFKPPVERAIVRVLQGEPLQLQSLIEAEGYPFRISQHLLYGLSNRRVARIVTLLPLSMQGKILSTYYLGIYIIVVASLLFSIIVAILASRTITQPLLKLVDQVSRLSLSDGLATRVTVAGVHEINTLGSVFNRMLDRLEQEHKMKDDFVATLTHDLKVPLLAEKQTLEYLSRGTYGDLAAEQHEILQMLQTANRSNLDLVNGILEIYRYDSGQVKLFFEFVALDRLLQEAILELRPLAEEKQIDLLFANPLSIDGSTDRSMAWADRLEIKRVLMNLLSNALTNTPKHGQVHCDLADRDSWGRDWIRPGDNHPQTTLDRSISLENRLMVRIRDSGIGFQSEDLPNLFRQFAAANRRRNPMSTGLGLYNCYQVIEAHRGDIWVETTEGQGSTVSFLLPQKLSGSREQPFVDRRHPGDRRQQQD